MKMAVANFFYLWAWVFFTKGPDAAASSAPTLSRTAEISSTSAEC